MNVFEASSRLCRPSPSDSSGRGQSTLRPDLAGRAFSLLALGCLLLSGQSIAGQEPCIPEYESQTTFGIDGNFGYNALEDFNRDGHLDLSLGLLFYLGDGSGSFDLAPVRVSAPWPHGFSGRFSDFNNDGLEDYALVGFGSNSLRFYYGTEGATERDFFLPGQTESLSSISSTLWYMDMADFDNNGEEDLVVISIGSTSHAVLLHSEILGNGRVDWDVQRLRTADQMSHYLAAGDYNGDGNADVAMGRDSEMSLFYGNGDGTFGSELLSAIDNNGVRAPGHRFRSADLDGDGRDDLFATAERSLLIYLGRDFDENGPPAQPHVALVLDGNLRFIEVVDLNDDDTLDVMTLSAAPSESIYKAFLSHGLDEDGIPEFASNESLGTSLSGRGSVLAVGDINEDGAPDVVVTTEDTNQARVILGEANCNEPPGDAPRGDINGDDLVDLSDAVALLQFLFLGGELNCPGVADVNADDSTDISDSIAILEFLFLGGPAPQGGPGPCELES